MSDDQKPPPGDADEAWTRYREQCIHDASRERAFKAGWAAATAYTQFLERAISLGLVKFS
jgi:hypothetical protein